MKKRQATARLLYAIRLMAVQIIIIMVCTCSLYGTQSVAQPILEKKVTVDVTNEELKTVINLIEKQSGIKFIYSNNAIDADRKISCHATDKALKHFLPEMLSPLRIRYRVVKSQILLYSGDEKGGGLEMRGNIVDATDTVIRGTIRDEQGNPLQGVTINIKGSDRTTMSDADGKYSMRTDGRKAVLVFSYVGFESEQRSVTGDQVLDISLKQNISNLDDVVIIGYGTVKRKDLTGAVSTLDGDELVKTPVANVAEALTGKIAGVQVVTTEGSPDAEIKVRLRGGGSISQDNSPLYVVDGFPVDNISNIASSDIETITFLKDAASTAIYGSRAANGVFLLTLKEGKAGKISVTANVYAGFRKISKMLDVLDPYEFVMYQYELDPYNGSPTSFENYYGAYHDLDIYKSKVGRDWQKEVFGRSAQQRYYNIGINGGTKATRFNLGLTRNDEQSIMLGSGYERNNLNFKLNSTISSRLSFDFNTRLSDMKIDGAGVNTGSGANTRLRNSVKYAPTRGLRGFDQSLIESDETNSPESASLLYDPVQSALDEYKKQKRLSSVFNGGVTWKIMSGLTFRSEGGYEFKNDRTDFVWGPFTSQAKNYGGQPMARIYSRIGNAWRFSNFLTYDKQNYIPGHSLNIVVGQEALSSRYKTVTDESRFFPLTMKADEVIANMNFGTPIPTATYISMDDVMSSYFGRINYSLADKYLATVTFRADGSSKFAPGKQWAFFPSAALAWKLSEEEFLKGSTWMDQLKLRVSMGSTGNNRIPSNAWQASYVTDNENKPYYPNETEASNFIPAGNLYNPELKWETTVNRNIGLDFTLFNNRLSGTLDVYKNTTRDLLVQAPIPTSSGYPLQYQNFGQTSNKGIELSLQSTLVNARDFSLTASFNIGLNKNNIDEYRNGDSDFKLYTSGWNGTAQPLEDYIVKQGEPIGQIYGYVTDGMYSFDDFTFNATTQKWDLNPGVASNSSLTSADEYFGPGALKFKDLINVDTDGDGKPDGSDGVINGSDRTIIGNTNPKHTGGFNINATFKGFDLGAFFNWSYGNDVYNANKLDFSAFGLTRRYQNIISELDLSHRFTTVDPATGNNIFYGRYANPAKLAEINQGATIWHPIMTQTYLHSWAIEDGSFLRLNTLTLGYTLPKLLSDKIGIGNIRVYVTGYNLAIITNYSGYDPEVDTRRSPPVTPGVDYSAYPKSRSFVGGINVTF